MGPAPVCGPIPLASHLDIVPHCLENGGQNPTRRAMITAESVEHELSDRSVPHQVGAAQNLEVTGHGRLWEMKDGLKIRDEERRRSQAIENPEPGGLGDREQQVGGRSGCGHIRLDEYKRDGKVG